YTITYSQNMVRFPHCAALFVVHEGLHKWQASCPEASASSAPSSFFPAEGGCWKQYDGRAGLRTAAPQGLRLAFLGCSVLVQSQQSVEKSSQFLCRELKNQAMRLSV